MERAGSRQLRAEDPDMQYKRGVHVLQQMRGRHEDGTIAAGKPTWSVSQIMLTIYHNPRCSKSRAALAIAEQFAAAEGLILRVVEYLKTPLTLEQLTALQKQLGVDARAMVRDTETEFAELGLDKADDAALLAAVARCPILLQRPIVVYGDRAVIARPPEALAALLPTR